MSKRIVLVQGSLVAVEDGGGLNIELPNAENTIEVDDDTFAEIRKNHKDYAWDKESRKIKRKEPKEKED